LLEFKVLETIRCKLGGEEGRIPLFWINNEEYFTDIEVNKSKLILAKINIDA
jgi:hypothetical protein